MVRNERASQLEDAQVDNGCVLIWLGQWNCVLGLFESRQTYQVLGELGSALDTIVREVRAHNDGQDALI